MCLVTGASAGIGKAASVELARRGMRVVMLCRDAERGERARRDVAAEAQHAPELVIADLASLDAVRQGAAEIARRWPAIHVLINNAGVSLARRAVSVDGFEMTLAVNHLAPFLLTQLLLPQLLAAPPARIVNVTSRLERAGRIHFDDLQCERRYSRTRAYNQSKLANVLFTYELADRLRGTGVTVNCIHPGFVATELMRDLPRWVRRLYEPFIATPEEGARGVVHLACAAELEGVTGCYFERDGVERASSARSHDAELRARLWRVSEELARLGHAPA